MSLDFWRKRAPKRPPKPTPPSVAPPPIEVVPVGSHQPIRVTDDSDGEAINRGYSYYPAAFIEFTGTILTFCGIVGKRPQWFRVELDGSITKLGALVNYDGEAEGWHLTASGDVMLCDGPRLKRVNPFTGAELVVLDVSATHPGCRLFQSHSSDDNQTHSATVERITSDGPYERLGTVAVRHGAYTFLERQGTLDESQVDASGRYLIVKEENYNRVMDLVTHEWVVISQEEGAVGHSDCGPGYVVGEDDAHGACVKWDLAMPMPPAQRRELAKTWNAGHFSVRAGRCLWSDATGLNLSLLALDGSGTTVLFHHGIDAGGDYDKQVRASLSPCGRVASYVANGALYLLRLT